MSGDIEDRSLDEAVDGFDEETSTEEGGRPALLSTIQIRGLFGRYNYDIAVPDQAASGRLVLMYGDNGRGKTTVLKILWHMLSPANNRSHRTSLLDIPFEFVRLELSDGVELIARRSEGYLGPYTLELRNEATTLASASWPDSGPRYFDNLSVNDLQRELQNMPEELRREAGEELGRRQYLAYLDRLAARPYYLADDRNIYSDDLDEKGRGRDAQRRMAEQRHGMVVSPADATQGLVTHELEISINRLNAMLNRLALGGTTSGSASANSVYLDVVRRLARAPMSGASDQQDVTTRLAREIEQLGARSRAFETLGLVPKLATDDFLAALEPLGHDRAQIANEVLAPYLASLRARLDALQEAQTLVQTFLDETNGFLQDKLMTFNPRTGLRVRVGDDMLKPSQFSSGERQLVLLLCNAMLARTRTRLFLIDEPELSLNVKWQRGILSALLACTEGTSVQFFVATHSVELLSSYRSNIVRLAAD